LPPIFVALALAVMGAAYSTHKTVSDLASKIAEHDRAIAELKSDVTYIRMNTVTQTQMLETMKRIEQQMEIMMLRAGIKARPNLTS